MVRRELFAGAGEMRDLCRALDWSATPLGAPDTWSHSLRTTAATVLDSRFPMFLWWGPELVQIYNDGYRPSLATAGHHPRALGQRGEECWTEIWEVIGPQIDAVMNRGEATWHVDQYLPIDRNGRLEEVYWTYSYSPVLDDDGSIGGTLVVCQETTQRVRATRRLRTMHEIATLPADGTTPQVVEKAVKLLTANERDIEFAICFLSASGGSADGRRPLAFSDAAGVGDSAADARLRMPDHWPLEHAMSSGELQLVKLSGDSAPGDAGVDARLAVVAPLENRANRSPLGALVIGMRPDLPWNEAYQDFVRVIARDLATNIAAREGNAERDRLVRALKFEQSRLDQVFRQAPAFLAILRGKDHVFELANDAYYQLVGHRDILHRPAVEALPEVRDQGFIELLTSVLETGTPFIGREIPVLLARTPNAPVEERFIDFVYQPVVEADGSRSGVVAHGSDVTEQVLARREVERLLEESETARAEAESARSEAERANRAKAEFLATMSHELRTPLNAIGGYTELIELGIHGPVTPAQASALARIQTSQRHLLGLINSVLNYTRVEAGAIRYDFEAVSVAAVLATCEALTAPQAQAKQLRLTVGADDVDGLAVRADREKLQQIILNLLSNAIKFTESAGDITVHCDAADEVVAIRVMDTGRGIPPERLDSVFDPFVQVDSRLTRTEEGVGLGLAISRDLARGMGGDLTVKSVSGTGSTFTLTVPRAE